MRTGAYKTISATEIYEGEIAHFNRVTSDIEFGEAKSQKVVGYIAYFRLLNGFEKYLYMSKEEVENHAKTYSKTYGSEYGIWKKNFDAMATKTVLKMLLSKYGMLSIEMNTAMVNDQAIIKDAEADNKEYIDNEKDSNSNKNADEQMIIDVEVDSNSQVMNELALTVIDTDIEAEMKAQMLEAQNKQTKDVIEKVTKSKTTSTRTRRNTTKKTTTPKETTSKVK